MMSGKRKFGASKISAQSVQDAESRFLRLYSAWHETHDLSLRRRLYVRLRLIMRRMPNFDLRSRFQSAF